MKQGVSNFFQKCTKPAAAAALAVASAATAASPITVNGLVGMDLDGDLSTAEIWRLGTGANALNYFQTGEPSDIDTAVNAITNYYGVSGATLTTPNQLYTLLSFLGNEVGSDLTAANAVTDPFNFASSNYLWVQGGFSNAFDVRDWGLFNLSSENSASALGVYRGNEVGVETVAGVVPEPGTGALLVGGLGALALAARRRQNAQAAPAAPAMEV